MSAERSPAPPPLDLVQAFINSADLERGIDGLATSTALRKWLVDRKLIGRSQTVTEEDREQATHLREALRRAVRGNNSSAADGRAVHQLNQLARRGRLVVAFDADGTVRLLPSVAGFDGALARILAAVALANLTGTWSRLKACANRGCQWAFYDASRNRSGRWCEMADCGNDAKGRAYRSRRRALVD